MTTFYCKVLDDHLPRAVELLSDIFHHASFLKKDIDKEKQVVMEEIRMVEDDPEDLVHDLHTQNVWKRHPLGRSILGTQATIEAISRDHLLSYIDRHYHPERVVLSVAGNFEFAPLMRLLKRYFNKPAGRPVVQRHRVSPDFGGRILVKKKRLEQVHLCLGLRGVSHIHQDRYAMYVLNTLLGGGISSRLFQEIREERGLAYSIYSYIASFNDVGLFNIYAGTGAASVSQVIRLILKELRKIRIRGVEPKELIKAKNHLKGNLMLGMESMSSRMSRLAKDELYLGRYYGLKDILREIDTVTTEQLHRLAREHFVSRHLSLTAMGPLLNGAIPTELAC
jgi:predicted Zn-dependent peptidase